MKKLIVVGVLLTNIIYATSCDDFKSKAIKYEEMGISASNLDMGARYLKMAIENKKSSIDTCFYSATDKKIKNDQIKDMIEIRKGMIEEAAKKRKHEIAVAREYTKNGCKK